MSVEVASSIRCECGSEDLMISFRQPLYVYIVDGRVTRAVVLSDQNFVLGGVARCSVCDRFWLVDEMPDFGKWPPMELA